MFRCGTDTVATSTGRDGSVMSNRWTVFPNQLERYMDLLYELADPGCPGLRLRVEPSGRRTFRWYTRDGDKRVVLTIGPWSERAEEGHVTLAEARQRLAALKAARDEGRLASERRASSFAGTVPTVREVARDFIAHLKRRRKTADQVERALSKDVLPVVGGIPIAAVTPRDVRHVVEAIVKRGSPSAKDHVFVHLNGLLRFAVGRGGIGTNPAATLDRDALGAEMNRRARVLSDEEIAAFWNALDRSGLTIQTRAGLRLLLLLGSAPASSSARPGTSSICRRRYGPSPSSTRNSGGASARRHGRGACRSPIRRSPSSSASACSPRGAGSSWRARRPRRGT